MYTFFIKTDDGINLLLPEDSQTGGLLAFFLGCFFSLSCIPKLYKVESRRFFWLLTVAFQLVWCLGFDFFKLVKNTLTFSKLFFHGIKMDFFSIEMSALCKRLFLFPPTKVKNRVGQKVARIWINWMMTWCLYSPSHIHPNCESSRVIAPIGKCLQVKREIGGRSAMKDNPRGKLWGSLWQGKCSLSTKNKKKKRKVENDRWLRN